MVKVSEVAPFSRMLLAPNALPMVGGDTAATVTVAVLLTVPVPPLVELTAPVVLFLIPVVAPVTLTDSVHEPAAATVAPLRLTDALLAVGVNVPPQVFVAFGELAT